MELIKERKLGKNILHWYPIEKESNVLQIGCTSSEIIEELCDKSNKLTVIVKNEKEKGNILEKVHRDNIDIKVEEINDLQTEKYDYVTLIGTLDAYDKEDEREAYQRLSDLIKFAKNNCKDEGVILLAVDNKFGMKFWTNLKADKNIICNQRRALSKKEIDKNLKENNLNSFKYYYVLPDLKATNVIFTDEYLPNLENINRNFLYGEEEFENFNQIEAFSQILKEDPEDFKFFANSFFIEIGNNELKDNNIKFVSYTNIRKEEYKIQTIIYNDRVEKTYVNPKAKNHIESIAKNISIMKKRNINTVDDYKDGKIISKYIENSQSFDKILLELLKQGKQNEFFEKINKYKNDLHIKLENVNFESIKENNIFVKYNVSYTDEQIKDMHFVTYGLWDLIFQNAFDIDNKLYFYDQEWFDYNVPIEFIIYRAIAYFPSAHSYINSEKLYKELGLEKYIDLFQNLDLAIQKEIRDEQIWNSSINIKTGQTLMNLYKNLIDEFENYKIMYNQSIVDENKKLKRQVDDLLNEREIIYNSRSWKITKPLRWLTNNTKSIK